MLNEGLSTDGMMVFVVLGLVAGFAVVGIVRALLNNNRKNNKKNNRKKWNL